MKVFINPGHAPDGRPDPGAVNQYTGLRECDVTKKVADLLAGYLTAAGVEVVGNLQDDSLPYICSQANSSGADIFISIHCNAAGNVNAEGTETWYHSHSINGRVLAECIQNQIVISLETTDRGTKAATPGKNGLYVLNQTNAVAVLVELAFISNSDDAILLAESTDDFARALARGVTDYEACQSGYSQESSGAYQSKYFSKAETECHCGCGGNVINPLLLQTLDQLRDMIGGPLELSCAYRCPAHNREVGGVDNSQHVLGNAADVLVPDYGHCNTAEQLAWYATEIGFDGIGIYPESGFVHVDVRDGGKSPGVYRWTE
ncbi:N-acetylmuramoyl-L-alanine amidase [Anaerovibrio lipolyticus DSM 3074]|uniref:N-acetylmuramoyl-L-alanine amidase n=1 Tax=Anaerovibrio lipolyticus DSM 3074 TaxID=1120997 RepID=A0A1M6E146_9FIRM|nr:N-acetylmuramoyl-L-alanine amidase [Anaerovibrio lipolyticus DSM 3074]